MLLYMRDIYMKEKRHMKDESKVCSEMNRERGEEKVRKGREGGSCLPSHAAQASCPPTPPTVLHDPPPPSHLDLHWDKAYKTGGREGSGVRRRSEFFFLFSLFLLSLVNFFPLSLLFSLFSL